MTNNSAPAPVSADCGVAAGIFRGLLLGAVVLGAVYAPAVGPDRLGVTFPAVTSTDAPSRKPSPGVRLADFGAETISMDARHLANWVADSRDNVGLHFIVVDKREARVYVFGADARLRAASPVLLGSARGDDSVPGIGSRPIAEVRPEERTTPAGRFIAERGHNLGGEDVVWVDYDEAVSMHRVRATNPLELRLERLATPTVEDNRISYGCINVPVAFYETYIRPAFAKQRGIVYVLPEVKPLQQVFASYDVGAARSLLSSR